MVQNVKRSPYLYSSYTEKLIKKSINRNMISIIKKDIMPRNLLILSFKTFTYYHIKKVFTCSLSLGKFLDQKFLKYFISILFNSDEFMTHSHP